jgi:hypothetical protein
VSGSIPAEAKSAKTASPLEMDLVADPSLSVVVAVLQLRRTPLAGVERRNLDTC